MILLFLKIMFLMLLLIGAAYFFFYEFNKFFRGSDYLSKKYPLPKKDYGPLKFRWELLKNPHFFTEFSYLIWVLLAIFSPAAFFSLGLVFLGFIKVIMIDKFPDKKTKIEKYDNVLSMLLLLASMIVLMYGNK